MGNINSKSPNRSCLGSMVTINSDGFGWTAFDCFHCVPRFFGCLRLAQDVGHATLIVLGVDCGSCLNAKVAIDAGIIDVEFAGRILWDSSGNVSHKMREQRLTHPSSATAARRAPMCPKRREAKARHVPGLAVEHMP